jgi:hypothetical protein
MLYPLSYGRVSSLYGNGTSARPSSYGGRRGHETSDRGSAIDANASRQDLGDDEIFGGDQWNGDTRRDVHGHSVSKQVLLVPAPLSRARRP